jgi:hypothetical protein
MLNAMRTYRDVGYDGMMMPDHVPAVEGDSDRLQGFAFRVRLYQGADRLRGGRRLMTVRGGWPPAVTTVSAGCGKPHAALSRMRSRPVRRRRRNCPVSRSRGSLIIHSCPLGPGLSATRMEPSAVSRDSSGQTAGGCKRW